jgi:hypothetical protein
MSTGTHTDTSSDSDAYEVHDNVATDLVQFVRSNTIRNEQQFVLLSLAYVSGLFSTHTATFRA